MKKKILALVLSMAVGITAFGMTAEAAGARINCSHPYLIVYCFPEYESANSVYHWVHEMEKQFCPTCSYEREAELDCSYEEHDFSVYTNDGRYCSGCGERDEFYY